MPPRCCQTDYDALFDDRSARRELAAYRRKGATGTTRRLIDAVRASGIEGASVLDIGGGVGVIGAELLGSGAARLTCVEASAPSLAAARGEIGRRGLGDRATFHHGDFVMLAASVDPADVVTLDRVVCCYADWQALIDACTTRARRLYALVYPIDRWWMRAAVGSVRLAGRLFGQSWPFHAHPERAIDARIRAAGFAPIHLERGVVWQTALYGRSTI